jgi:regulator of cell morphogenesis and NO signaling
MAARASLPRGHKPDAVLSRPRARHHQVRWWCRENSQEIAMQIDANKTVRELALENPNATRVFERLGIDYCCGGGKSLSEACATAQLPLEQVVESLAQEQPAPATRDWSQASLAELIQHIVETHHVYVKQEAPRLEQLAAKVASVHGQNHPEVLRIRSTFSNLAMELGSHLMKEEQILFPYIVEMEEAAAQGHAAPPCGFGTIQNPVRMMMFEHDSAGAALRELRAASSDYTTPADACVTYKTFYAALEAFEADLHQHIHLENNILFPRATQMEAAA